MTEKAKAPHWPWYIYLPLCVGLGTAAGALLGNVGLGIAIGAAIGTPLNLYFYYKGERSRGQEDS